MQLPNNHIPKSQAQPSKQKEATMRRMALSEPHHHIKLPVHTLTHNTAQSDDVGIYECDVIEASQIVATAQSAYSYSRSK